MASIHPQPSKLLARDIVRFSDAELDQYLEANRRLVHVEDPKNLPEDFIQRLRVRADTSDTTKSRSIDLDGLSIRLEQIPPRSPSLASTEDLGEEEYYRLELEDETEHYNTLIREGGRPSHLVSLGRDILEDPGEQREILSYWQLYNGDAENRKWKVFGPQMGEWKRFLKYQRKHRQDGRFPAYINQVKHSCAKHGFTRPYQLDEDPERQDKLTIWIEFLSYQYGIYDRYMAMLRLRQPMYDEAWKELVDSQVLRPHETEEFICSTDSVYQRAGEKERAKRAVESAKKAVISAEKSIADPGCSNISQRDRLKGLLVIAQSKLDLARKSLELIKKRNDLFYEFFKKTGQMKVVNDEIVMSYRGIKKRAERRTILLRWILQQIPLIELELSVAKVTENNASEKNSQKRKFKRNRTDESDVKQDSKRQRRGGESDSIPQPRTHTKDHVSLLKCSYHEPLDEGRASKRPKRDDQKSRVSAHETSNTANPTPMEERLSIQPSISQDSRSVRSHSIRRAAPKKTRPEVKIPAKVVLDGKVRVMKRGRRARKPSDISIFGTSPRRSTWARKPPERF